MNRDDISTYDTTSLNEAMKEGPHRERWDTLTQLAGEDAERILRLVCKITPPSRIDTLRKFEVEQAEHGAGFLGMLPDQIPDNLGKPDTIETSLDVTIRLAEIRKKNMEAIRETIPMYPLAFTGKAYEPSRSGEVPDGWALDVDVSGIQAVLDAFETTNFTPANAVRIAQMPAFQEMMTHRRELGYVPEPLIDDAGFSWCLTHAVSRDPVDEIWKWLHPHNLFDLSDLYAHRTEYQQLIDVLAGESGLASWILPRISRFAPPGTVFEDRFAFAVGWGIRGWATQQTGGMNIEQAKDDWDLLVSTLIHETYHRLQTKIAFANPDVAEIGFDRITSLPASAPGNQALYRALAYVMLEGSATYVAATSPSSSWEDDARPGVELLERARTIEGSENVDEAADAILNEGLKSNGPFYGFGALLARAIVGHGNESDLGVALSKGGPSFVQGGLRSLKVSPPEVSEGLADSISALCDVVEGIGR